MGRYIIEGTWAGYRSGQDHVAHRSVHESSERRLRAWAEQAFSVTFTDGTRLILSVRDCKRYERVKEKHAGYMSLIRDCAHYNVCCVADLMAEQAAARDQRGK
jgi:hypothetical protein